MRALAGRIGLYRLAALLVGCALVLEIVRVQVVPSSTAATAALTLGEVVFLALAAALFLIARRRPRGSGVRD
jgi:hypothetical protein